jgi:hypothetical protein
MVQQESLSYSEFASLFSQMICTFVFPMTTTNRFSIGKKKERMRNYILIQNHLFQVDFGAIWCEALCNIIDAFPNTTAITSV